MKKVIAFTTLVFLCIGFVLSCSAEASKAPQKETLRWYTRFHADNCAPSLGQDQNIIMKHKAFYIHKNGREPEKKVIYLTFDVGYHNENLTCILDTLQAEKVPAAFFVLEHLVCANADVVKRMGDEGHLICNHTARHKDMTKATREEFAAELKKMEQLLKEKTGHSMASFYRPPRGEYNEQNLVWAEELGYTTVFWSLAYADWDNQKQADPEKATQILSKRMHPGAIVLLHPTSKTNALILKSLIEKWKAEGYIFASLKEL